MGAFLLAGCSEDVPWDYSSTNPVVATPNAVSVRLADAADKAANALQSLAAVEQTRTPAPLPPVVPNPSDELKDVMAIDWTGPIEPLLQRLALRTGYTYQQIGSPPATPITVTVDTEGKTILESLRDVGMQAGSRADLIVDSSRKVIELEYGPIAR